MQGAERREAREDFCCLSERVGTALRALRLLIIRRQDDNTDWEQRHMRRLGLWRLWRRLKYRCERRVLTWTALRRIGHLPLMKANIFVPLIGYLIIFNDELSHHLNLAWEKDAAPPTNLLLVYFGLVFLSIGSILYAIFCERQIDHYGSAEAFVGGDGPNMSAISVGYLKKRLEDSGYDFAAWHEDRIEAIGKRDELKDILQCAYDDWDKKYPVARGITTVLYLFGFSILAIPALRVFWKVSGILFHRLAL